MKSIYIIGIILVTSMFCLGKDTEEISAIENYTEETLPTEETLAEITIMVRDYPATTPEDEGIYIAGNFNGWAADNELYRLSKSANGYELTLSIAIGEKIEYKFTRGSWITVEKGVQGEEIANRVYQVTAGKNVVNCEIKNWRDQVEPVLSQQRSTVSGNVEIIKNFDLKELGRKRNIRIYLPPDYNNSNKRYPVLYMHDGQNLFDNETSFSGEWEVDETLERLFNAGTTDGLIVVGIDNHAQYRLTEYSPWYNNERRAGGDGDKYVTFLVETLKPWIDNNYRTLPDYEHTAIAGSSMGGLISLYAGCRYPGVFSKLGLFSPAFWFAKQELLQYIKTYPPKFDCHIYIDAGTEEGSNRQMKKAYLEDARGMKDFLRSSGIPAENLMLVIEEGARHHESHWARRFPAALCWMYQWENK